MITIARGASGKLVLSSGSQLRMAALAFSVSLSTLVIPISFTLLTLSLKISSAMIRSCRGQPCFDLPPVQKFKFYKQRWRLAIGHFGQTNNHDWPQNYAANPSLTLPMAPGIAAHLQTAENPLIHNLKLDLKESEAKVVRAQCAVSQFNGCSR